MQRNVPGVVSLAALTAVVVWGASFVATRLALTTLSPFALVAARKRGGDRVLGTPGPDRWRGSAREFTMHGAMRPPTDEIARWEHLADELRNFQEVAQFLRPSPGDVPRIDGLDLACLSLPLHDVFGGGHVAWVDFDRRYDLHGRIAEAERGGREEIARNLRRMRQRAGVLVADVSGHRVTDALVAAMLHQAFLLGVNYELDLFGEVTTHLFDSLNTRFHQTTAVNKFFTMIYGEISEGGKLRFLSAGHPPPAVFSRAAGAVSSSSSRSWGRAS